MHLATSSTRPGYHGWSAEPLSAAGALDTTPRLTAITTPTGAEVGWVGADGSVSWATTSPGQPWSSALLAGPGSAAPAGAIRAVAKDGGLAEVWWLGPDGSVQAAYRESDWGRYELAPAGSAALGGDLAAISKGGDRMEVWWIGVDGSVQAAFHDGGWERYQLAGPGEAATTTGITAITKGGDRMEVWWIGPDASVQGAYHDPTWTRYAMTSPGMASLACRPSSWVGQTRHDVTARLWWISSVGDVWLASFDGAWAPMAIGAQAQPAGSVAGCALNSETPGVVWGGVDGAVVDGVPDEVTLVAHVSGGRALRGVVGITVRQDGSSEWWGDLTNDTFYGYDYAVSAFVREGGLPVELAAVHRGSVAGYATPGSSDDLWSAAHPARPALVGRQAGLRFGALAVRLEHSVDVVDYLGRVVDGIFETTLGAVLTPVGAVLVLGAEIVSLATTGSLVPGTIVAAGVPWLTGPSGMFVQLVADAAGDRGRVLTEAEYAWVDDAVFAGSLPPRGDVLLTAYTGLGGRPFTFPTATGSILVNVGAARYADPRSDEATIVHELVHACQIAHSTDLGFTLSAILAQGSDAVGGAAYDYGPAGFDYSGLGIEAQAQIVEDWFRGRPAIARVPEDRGHTGRPCDPESPYYRYVTDDLRLGRF
ncbi:MAG TPA: hypothetical protein P5181_06340 [Dermatophilaceae bacterium]|nr:hypothetical protein [Dermatophilaceae bacterium]